MPERDAGRVHRHQAAITGAVLQRGERLAAHEVLIVRGGAPRTRGRPRTDRRAGPMSWPHERKPRSSRAASKAKAPACRSPRSSPAATIRSYRSLDELRRHRQLPAQLSGERDAERPRRRPAHLDLACRQERERLVREVFVGEARQQLPRPGSCEVQGRPPARDVGDHRPGRQHRLRSSISVRRWASVGASTRNRSSAMPRDGGVHLDPAALVADHRVHHASDRHVDVRRAEPLQVGQRRRPLDHELRVGRQVVERHRLRASLALRRARTGARKVRRSRSVTSGSTVPGSNQLARSQPAACPNEAPAARMRSYNGIRRMPRAVTGCLPGQCISYRPPSDSTVRSRSQPRALDHRPIRATSTSVRSIGGVAVHDPLRQRHADAGAVDDALGVQAGRHEQAGHLGELAQLEVRVGREALGRPQVVREPDRLELGQALSGVRQHRREVIPVGAELDEPGGGARGREPSACRSARTPRSRSCPR